MNCDSHLLYMFHSISVMALQDSIPTVLIAPIVQVRRSASRVLSRTLLATHKLRLYAPCARSGRGLLGVVWGGMLRGFALPYQDFYGQCSVFGSPFDIFPEKLGRQTPTCPMRSPSNTLSPPLARNQTSVAVIDHIGAASDRKRVSMIHSEAFESLW